MYDNFKIANYNNSLVSPNMYARQFAKFTTGDIIARFGVMPGTGLKVVVDAGDAIIRPLNNYSDATGQFVSLIGATFELSIPAPDASNPRIDLVVLYVDNAVELPVVDANNPPTSANLDGPGVAKAIIVSGTPAATPVAPTTTAIQAAVSAGNNYTVLAQVRVDPGVSVIASNKITDVRKMAVITADKIDFASFESNTDWDSGWVNIALTNGWSVGGSNTPQVRRIGSVIYLRGQIIKTSASAYEIAAIIPAGFRPASDVAFAITSNSTIVFTGRIDPNGSINLWSSATSGAWRSLHGASGFLIG